MLVGHLVFFAIFLLVLVCPFNPMEGMIAWDVEVVGVQYA
jgi:hypothetical protein